MAIFDKILKKEKQEKRPEKTREADAPRSAAKDINLGAGIGVIASPHVTEKSVAGAERGAYVFRVREGSNKVAVKKAVAERYGVTVVSVNIVKQHGKKRRIGRREGMRSGFTKAVVTIKSGEAIELE